MTDLYRVQTACQLLREARLQLKLVGAVQACAKVRRALDSAEGAERHARGLQDRPRPRRVKRASQPARAGDTRALDRLKAYYDRRELSADDWDFLFLVLEQTGRPVAEVDA